MHHVQCMDFILSKKYHYGYFSMKIHMNNIVSLLIFPFKNLSVIFNLRKKLTQWANVYKHQMPVANTAVHIQSSTSNNFQHYDWVFADPDSSQHAESPITKTQCHHNVHSSVSWISHLFLWPVICEHSAYFYWTTVRYITE